MMVVIDVCDATMHRMHGMYVDRARRRRNKSMLYCASQRSGGCDIVGRTWLAGWSAVTGGSDS